MGSGGGSVNGEAKPPSGTRDRPAPPAALQLMEAPAGFAEQSAFL
jgi:hypothetical protein